MAGRTIAIIGDSQADGLSRHLAAELARRRVGVVTGTTTVTGATTRVLLDREKPQALMEQSDADLVIVALGGNDSAGSTYARTLEQFVRALRRSDGTMPEIVWIGPAYAERADVDARHLVTSRVQASVLPGLGVRWYDSREWTTDGPGAVHAGDGVHFTSDAYAHQATAVVDRILSQFPVALVLGLVGGLAALGGLVAASIAWEHRR